jgi:hypothetical protein
MKTLKEIFDPDELALSPPKALCGNYYFSTLTNPVLSAYTTLHEEIRLLEDPIYLVRKYFLTKDPMKDTPIQVTISLAWDGYERALDFLFGFTESLDLFFDPEKVIDARAYAIGDFGVAWSWVPGEINVIVFIRNNVFVGIQGFLQKEDMLSASSAIDAGLIKVATNIPYNVEKQGFIIQSRSKPGQLSVPTGGRLDIGIQKPATDTYFFITKDGSMNRDLHNPNLWYFRAGEYVGIHEIVLLRVDNGILPKKEILQVEVVKGE